MTENINNIVKTIYENLSNGIKLNNMKNILHNIDKKSFEKYIKFCDDKYCKNNVISNDIFEIIIICWKKGQSSKIHDHPENGCLLKILSGSLIEYNYLYENNKIIYLNCDIITDNDDDIGYKESNIILHKIIALEDTISLHIYSPPNYKLNIYE